MKKNLNILVYALFTFLLLHFTACRDGKPQATVVNGQVRTFGTEDPIQQPPVKVQLLERIPVATWGSSDSYEVVDEIMTDENRRFSLSADLYKDKRYYLSIDQNTISSAHHYQVLNYRDYSNNHPEWQLKSVGGTVNQNFYMVARGWVNFHFLSENPQPGDKYSYSVGGGGYESFYNSVDEYRVWDFSGNMEHRIVYTLVRGGEAFPKEQFIYVPAFDTIEVQIKF